MMLKLSQGELDVAVKAAREAIDETGYGSFVSDDVLTGLVARVLRAVEQHREKHGHSEEGSGG